MTKYQLAKLILLADGIRSRKRIQKTVHLLQAAGCPLEVSDYRIHYYGPYSKSLARLVDDMTSSDMLVETAEESGVGRQFNYRVNAEAEKSLKTFERSSLGAQWSAVLQTYSDLLHELRETPPRVLELASTIVAFSQAGNDFEKAKVATAEFKKEDEQSCSMEGAVALAEKVLDWPHADA